MERNINQDRINSFLKEKYKFIDWLLSDNCDLSKFEKLSILDSNNLLPYGTYYNDCPSCFGDNFWGDLVDYKYKSINFFNYCSLEYINYFDNVKTLDEIIDCIYEFVKNKRLIGTHYDW